MVEELMREISNEWFGEEGELVEWAARIIIMRSVK
jgi:hypothetical protein